MASLEEMAAKEAAYHADREYGGALAGGYVTQAQLLMLLDKNPDVARILDLMGVMPINL